MPQDGCEREITEPLVVQINHEEARQYVFQACLDKGHYAGKKAQPEILYVDEATSERLVIEVKHLVWPRRYAQWHKTDHEIATEVGKRIKPLTREAPYELVLPHLFRGNAAQVEAFVGSVVHAVASNIRVVNDGKVIGSRRPGREWTFRRQDPSEREEGDPPIGLGAFWNLPNGLDPERRERARRELVPVLTRQYQACVKKFAGYTDARRILVISFVGDLDFDDSDWDELLKLVPIPEAVQEIWKADYTWVTDWSQDWVFSRLYRAHADGSVDDAVDGLDA
jgi:hypothetical protein